MNETKELKPEITRRKSLLTENILNLDEKIDKLKINLDYVLNQNNIVEENGDPEATHENKTIEDKTSLGRELREDNEKISNMIDKILEITDDLEI